MNAVRQTRKFSSCVKSDAYEKPTITFILKGIGWGSRDETATATKSRLPNAIGWRTCGLGPGSSTYFMSYGTTASSRFVYQETSGLKTMPCDYKLQGDIAPGKKKTCWSHKPKSTPNVNWRRCATDGKVCKTGLSKSEIAKGAYLKARYGKGSKWVYRYVSANFSCGSAAMGMDAMCQRERDLHPANGQDHLSGSLRKRRKPTDFSFTCFGKKLYLCNRSDNRTSDI